MTEIAPERSPRGGLGRLVAGVIGYLVVAPVGFLALPLASLTAVSRSRGRTAGVVGFLGGLVALWWLLLPGTLPDQTARAAAVLATAAFVLATMLTQWSVIHRALIGLVTAATAVTGGYLAYGFSWGRLHWWVEHRTTLALRFMLSGMWRSVRPVDGDGTASGPSHTLLNQLESGFDTIVRTMADLFPATVALQLLAGIGLAAALYHRFAARPLGRSPRPFRFFRFSEHLGWAVVIPLVVFLMPAARPLKLFAANVLVVMATLYAVRGAAVAYFGLLVARAGPLLYATVALAVFLLLPFVPGAAVVLGVVDSGLDLRRRWTTPPTR